MQQVASHVKLGARALIGPNFCYPTRPSPTERKPEPGPSPIYIIDKWARHSPKPDNVVLVLRDIYNCLPQTAAAAAEAVSPACNSVAY